MALLLMALPASATEEDEWAEFPLVYERPVGTLFGQPRVVDGDTLKIAGVSVRLLGIDAPEKQQMCLDRESRCYPCGKHITNWLKEQIQDSTVLCELTGEVSYNRPVGACTVTQTNHGVEHTLLVSGWATLVPEYIEDPDTRFALRAIEAYARKNRLGIWGGEFIAPALWRAGQRLAACE